MSQFVKLTDEELDEIFDAPPSAPEVVLTKVKVRLSCNHVKIVRVPVDMDFSDYFVSSTCPEGCGQRLIAEEIQEEK